MLIHRFVSQAMARYYWITIYFSLRFFYFYSFFHKCAICYLQLFAWGTGACLGRESNEAKLLLPERVEALAREKIIDISVGESHVLALTEGEGGRPGMKISHAYFSYFF